MTLADDLGAELTENQSSPLHAAYADDPYTWAPQQARRLRAGELDQVDAVNLADEMAVLACYHTYKLRSDLRRVLKHLLKWDYQPQVRTRSWVLSIEEHRRRVATRLQESPGLRSVLTKLLAEAYKDGRSRALDEMGLPRSALPETCPYTWDEIMSRPIDWPEAP